jgi:NTE family protein
MESLTSLSQAIPTGFFDNEPISRFFSQVYSKDGRSNDFRKLQQKLFVIAVEIDTGESVKFGAEGYDHIPISKALQASTALPGLYPPVEINGHYYVDGALIKTMHASVALDEGADLVICLNRPSRYPQTRHIDGGRIAGCAFSNLSFSDSFASGSQHVGL